MLMLTTIYSSMANPSLYGRRELTEQGNSEMPETRTHIRRLPAGHACDVFAERRLETALNRFAPRVRAVSVRVTDLNGPKGGPDKRCLIAVRLERPNRLILIEQVHSDHLVAIGRAVDRAARAVARAVRAADERRYLRAGE